MRGSLREVGGGGRPQNYQTKGLVERDNLSECSLLSLF